MHIKEKIPLIFGVPEHSFYNGLKAKKVFVAELRPGLEGARAVAAELLKRGIRPVIVCDNMMAFCMKRGLVKNVHIFYNALKKDAGLCRTGSFVAALCASWHKVPVYLHRAAYVPKRPASLLKIDGVNVTAQNLKTYVPIFEEVPLRLTRSRESKIA